jgi:hypothetical protein
MAHEHKNVSWEHQNLRKLIPHDENQFQNGLNLLNEWLTEADAVLLSGGGKFYYYYYLN